MYLRAFLQTRDTRVSPGIHSNPQRLFPPTAPGLRSLARADDDEISPASPQSKLGALFRPVLPRTQIREVEPPFPGLKKPLSPLTEPEAKLDSLPSVTTALTASAALSATANTTLDSREIM